MFEWEDGGMPGQEAARTKEEIYGCGDRGQEEEDEEDEEDVGTLEQKTQRRNKTFLEV